MNYRGSKSNCVIVPSASGSIDRCIQMEVPSMGSLLLALVIGIIVYLAVAYAIYWFMNRMNPGMKFNYWWILLILILSGIITGIISSVFVAIKTKKKVD